MTSCKICPKTTWRNYFMSEGLAGGDFCATRLPIRITVLLSRCKGKQILKKNNYLSEKIRNEHNRKSYLAGAGRTCGRHNLFRRGAVDVHYHHRHSVRAAAVQAWRICPASFRT